MLVSVGILPPHAKLQTPAFLKHTMQYKRKLMERAAFLEACYLGSQMIPLRHQAGQAEHGKGRDMPAERDKLNNEYAFLGKMYSFLGTVRKEFERLRG